jgi:hypothetical protein
MVIALVEKLEDTMVSRSFRQWFNQASEVMGSFKPERKKASCTRPDYFMAKLFHRGLSHIP